ncbi:MAG: hypothetical protein ACFE9S_03470 [Candidatus Hermodarchaeota archaeon]
MIKDRFTAINGKIKKNLLSEYKNDLFLELSQDLNVIPIIKFIELLQEQTHEFQNLLKANEILSFLHEYLKIISNNIAISSKYNEIIDNILIIFEYIKLQNQKESLLKELELSTHYKKSSDIAATKDLLKKLNESLTLNIKKLELFEEDFFQRKNQIDQIKKTLGDYNSKIQQLTNQKKDCFSQINRITREMAGDKPEPKKNINVDIIEFEGNLSNAEKIRAIQRKAKEFQSEINDINSKKNQTQLKLEELTPPFEIFEKDHQALLDLINTDKNRINELKSELRKKFKEENITEVEEFDVDTNKSLRSSIEIKSEIERTEIELEKFTLSDEIFNLQNPFDLSLIIEKVSNLYKKIFNNESNFIISNSEKELNNCLQQYKILENSISNIESLVNKFLIEISINSQFNIIISEDQTTFFISLLFVRRDKEKVRFEDLTTPEKIFFIIVFYLSIKLHINENHIIFSNVSILSQYNKAGSIYRTIRKILPLFEKEKVLSPFKLTFILSNLELKKDIKNLKIITVEEC